MNGSDIVLETVELTRDFDGHTALQGLNLTVGKGDILALAGPNGAGKSTLLKLVAGHLKPASGTALLWGKPCWPPTPDAARVSLVLDGAVPGGRALVRDLFSLRACVCQSFDRSLAVSLCEQHHIGLSNRWTGLSKGQRRWVLLATALASGAELLLLDEPADGLDVASRREFYGLLRKQANDRGVTIVLASHIMADIERVADDIVILVGGRLRLHSPIEQLRDEVREIQFHTDVSLDDISSLAEIIASHRVSNEIISVVRFRSPYLAEQTLPGEIGQRRIGLEELYLAYTASANSEGSVASSSYVSLVNS